MSGAVKKKQQKKRARKQALIYLRYWLPVAAVVLVTVWLFVPCLRYTTSETGTNETISVFELLRNSWDQSRAYLFGGGEQHAANTEFCWVVLVTVAVSALLYLVGAVAAVWSLVGAVRYFRGDEERDTARILYVTLFPNRIVTCIWEALSLVLLLYPRILILYYEHILSYRVLLSLVFPEPLILGAVLFLAVVVLSIVTAPMESALGRNPFRRTRRDSPENGEEPQEVEQASEKPVFETEAERRYYELNERAKAEQAERIRQLLLKQEDDDEKTE